MANLSLPNLLFTLFLVLLPVHALTQTSTNVSLGDSLSTDGSSNWVSPSGDFAFGFRRVGSQDLFLLAIWFDKIPEKTIVWSANPDNPVRGGSKVELTTDGRLVLADPQGQEIWKREVTNGTVTSAALLNTGNFVLLGEASATKWQSFAEPTNTILPTQELPLGTELVAPETESNYTRGRFKLTMQLDGNLVLYPLATISDIRYNAYWATDTVGNGSKLVFNESGYIYLPLKSGNLRYLTTENVIPMPTTSYYQRATLDYDGVFRQYYHPRSPESDGSGSQNWTISQFVPADICSAIRADNGGGACGFNGYCRLDDSRQPTCNCPPQYISLDPNHTYKGCMPNFTTQSCETDESSRAGPQFRLFPVDNVDWPLADYEHYNLVSEDKCQEACLSDCFCAVAIYRAAEGDCWKKKLPLSNGRMNPNVGRRAFIKVPRSNSTQSSPPGVIKVPTVSDKPPSTSSKKDRTGLIVGIVVGVSALCITSIFAFIMWRLRRRRIDEDEEFLSLTAKPNTFSYSELRNATDDFSPANKLGEGGFGSVYKGILSDGKVVAVKLLSVASRQGKSQFVTEIATISAVQHKNLVKLYGCCIEGDNRLLVYEFLENKSLDQALFGRDKLNLDWPTRYDICLGTAKGLSYLHEESRLRIVHRDVKASNILLDAEHVPKISDFGLAKLYDDKRTHMSTRVAGTIGYLAPEYAMRGHLTEKADVFAFGVVALEILSGRPNQVSSLDKEKIYLLEWAWNLHENDKELELIDPTLPEFNEAELLRLIGVALLCIQASPSMRPPMSRVVAMLSGDIEVTSVTSRPGYLTDWQLDEINNFMTKAIALDRFRAAWPDEHVQLRRDDPGGGVWGWDEGVRRQVFVLLKCASQEEPLERGSGGV
ncbi:hypothetical protein ACLOJK_017442 [Asimina triloba]